MIERVVGDSTTQHALDIAIECPMGRIRLGNANQWELPSGAAFDSEPIVGKWERRTIDYWRVFSDSKSASQPLGGV